MLPVPGKHGRYRLGQVGQRGLAVFLTSRGELTAYDWTGELLWQVGVFVGHVCNWQGDLTLIWTNLDIEEEDEPAELFLFYLILCRSWPPAPPGRRRTLMRRTRMS